MTLLPLKLLLAPILIAAARIGRRYGPRMAGSIAIFFYIENGADFAKLCARHSWQTTSPPLATNFTLSRLH